MTPAGDLSEQHGGAVDLRARVAELEATHQRLEVQFSVARALSGHNSPDEALNETLRVIGTGLGWPLCNLWRTDGPNGVPHWAAAWISPELTELAQPFAKVIRQSIVPTTPTSLVGRVRSTGKAAWIPDVSADASFIGAIEARSAGLHSALGLPIVDGDGVLAVVSGYGPAIAEPGPEMWETFDGILAQLRSYIGRCRADESLRLANAQRAVIMESVADGIVAVAPDGRLVYANTAAARSAGYSSAEEMLAAPPDDMAQRFATFHEDGRPFDRADFLSSVSRDGREEPLTLRYRVRATGEERWTTSRARSILDEHGDVALVVAVSHDVSALKRREVDQTLLARAGELLATEMDYRERMKGVADLAVPLLADWCAVDLLEENGTVTLMGLAHVDPSKVTLAREWRYRHPVELESPSGVANVIRTGASELVVTITEDMYAAIDDPELLEILDQIGMQSAMIVPLVARGRIYGAATFIWAETGRHYDVADLEVAEELGRRVGLAVDNARLYESMVRHNSELEERIERRTALLAQSNTQLRQESAERERAAEHLRVALESVPDAMVIASQDGVIMDLNSETARLFGYQAAELVGRNVEILLPRRYHGSHRRHRTDYMIDPHRRPMGVGLDLQARRKDGSEFPVEISLSPLRTDRGTWVMSAIRDITARKQAEADLEELRRRLLEGREEERMLIAQDLHEGPLQSLFGLSYQLEGVLNADSEADRRARLESVQTELRNAADTIRAICTDLQPPALAPFGLEPAIRSRLQQVAADHSELTVTDDLTPDGQMLSESLRIALYRIFQEAVANVVRHADATHLTVRLEVDAEGANLEIADDGIGFEIPRRWVEFARRGHLGIVGAAGRAEAVGGRLYVTSQLGAGTVVRAAVPLPEPHHDSP